MLSDAKVFWWPEMRKDIEQKVKDCTACLATGKNLKYQIPKKLIRKIRKTIRTRTTITNRFYQKSTYQNFERRTSNTNRNRSVQQMVDGKNLQNVGHKRSHMFPIKSV